MYAVFKLGGNQHKASVGDVLEVDSLSGEVGDKVEIDDVLLLAKDGETIVGAPGIDGAKVVVEIVSHGRQKKILVVKFKRRKKYRRKAGHRQQFTSIKITDVVAPGSKAAAKKSPSRAPKAKTAEAPAADGGE